MSGECISTSPVRKVEPGELAEDLLGGRVIGECGFNLRQKSPQIAGASVLPDHAYPALVSAIKMDTLVLGGAWPTTPSFVFDLVSCVLSVRALTKIGASIIETIPRNMIDGDSIRCPKNLAVHQNDMRVSAAPSGIATPSAPEEMPFECIDPLKILVIDERDETLGQRNLTRHISCAGERR